MQSAPGKLAVLLALLVKACILRVVVVGRSKVKQRNSAKQEFDQHDQGLLRFGLVRNPQISWPPVVSENTE